MRQSQEEEIMPITLQKIAKRWILLSFFALLCAFGGSSSVEAKPPAEAKPQEAQRWIRLTMVDAKIWPVRSDGSCWDPCGWGQIKLPPRALVPYAEYLRDPNFVKMTTGRKAPDVFIRLKIGQHLLQTPVQNNTTQPRWMTRHLLPIRSTDRFHLAILDKDTWGSEVIGQLEEERLPQAFFQGGTLRLQKLMQVEEITFHIEQIAEPHPPKQAAKAQDSSSLLSNADAAPSSKPVEKSQLKGKQESEARKKNAAASEARKKIVEQKTTKKEREKDTLVKAGDEKKAVVKGKIEKSAVTKSEIEKKKIGGEETEKKAGLKKGEGEKKTVEMKPPPPPARLFRVTQIKAHIWPVKASQQCWDCWGKTMELPPRGLREFTPYYTQPAFRKIATGSGAPDPWAEVAFGEQRWKTAVLQDTLQPIWKEPQYVRVRRDDPISIRLWDKDPLSSEEIGSFRAARLPDVLWEHGGIWEIPAFGQVERVFVHLERLPMYETKLPITEKPLPIPPSVQFVRITVVRAEIWPTNAAGGCWDSCPMKGQVALPPRGLKDQSVYEKDANYKALSTGRSAPDPRVKIQIGKHDLYITPTLDNTIRPAWGASHVFRIRGNEPVTISVFDDDETIAHDFFRTYRSTRELIARWAEEEMGRYHSPYLPEVFLRGGTLILRSFGQVDLLELKIEPLEQVVQDTRCEGVYRVRVAEVNVKKTRADGKPWHAGYGSMVLPSPFVTVWLGNQKLETPVAHNRLQAIYQSARLIPIQRDTTFAIEVSDFSVGLNLSLDRQISIPFLPLRVGLGMRRDPDVQQMGQTARLSACELIKEAKQGRVTLPPFGQVSSVLLFFDRVR
jgi:hypothetical protein